MPARTVYNSLLGRVRSLSRSNGDYHDRTLEHFPRRSRLLSLESFMSFGMGSDCNGGTVTTLTCANQAGKLSKSCSRPGTILCHGCHLVKYCSEKCRKNHWPSHRSICFHPYLDPAWHPAWVLEGREPVFLKRVPDTTRSIWSETLAIDCLRVSENEGMDAENMNLNLCFVASGDITSLVSTVNGLPQDYSGQCKILFNDLDSVVVNRNLFILFALLRVGPSLDEAAEFATHLMYSAALPSASAAYWEQCLQTIYGKISEGDMSFRTSLSARGGAIINSTQTTMGIRQPLEMFQSNYDLRQARKEMHNVTMDPAVADDEDRFFATLRPVHRLAFKRFRETGVLAPFSLNTSNFSYPNRLLFSSSGRWLSPPDANPLRSWDLDAVQRSGAKHGVDPADIFGALFFHVKSQLREFARRVKDFNISIHLTQCDPRVLSKGISCGILPEFAYDEGFDRVELSNMMDSVGLRECLDEWAPLINRRNPYASILIHSKFWHLDHLRASAKSNPKVMDALRRASHQIPGLLHGLFSPGWQSPSLARLVYFLDPVFEHEDAFEQYLINQDVEDVAASYGLFPRNTPRVRSKRFGVPLDPSEQTLPELTRNEYYDLFTIGGAELAVRFLEFEVHLN